MEPQQLYLDLYKEYRNEIRHQETQRATVSTICVGLAAGLIGLSFQERSAWARPYLGVLLMNFSLVAIFNLLKLYERFAIGRERARLYLNEVDRSTKWSDPAAAPLIAPNSRTLRGIWILGRENHEEDYKFWSFVRLHDLWASLLIGSFLVGLLFCLSPYLHKELPKWLPIVLALSGITLQTIIIRLRQAHGSRKERARRALEEAVPATTQDIPAQITEVNDQLWNSKLDNS
jgi:hypothetical protein